MPNKCSVAGCFTNFKGHQAGTVFELTQDEALQPIWRKFLNREGSETLKTVFICVHHFEEKYISRNTKIPWLIKTQKPIPTIHPTSTQNRPSLQPSIPKLRKPPTQRTFQPDELEDCKAQDTVNSFDDVFASAAVYVSSNVQIVARGI